MTRKIGKIKERLQETILTVIKSRKKNIQEVKSMNHRINLRCFLRMQWDRDEKMRIKIF